MCNKKYALAAWTEHGEVRMVPSLVYEAAKPYRERIEKLEARYEDYEDSELEGMYLSFTRDDRETDEEFDRALATIRAWRFGRTR